MPASMWAPSSAPAVTLSRMLAHDGSRDSDTSSPCLSNSPRSKATASGAASVSGTKPIESLVFSSAGRAERPEAPGVGAS